MTFRLDVSVATDAQFEVNLKRKFQPSALKLFELAHAYDWCARLTIFGFRCILNFVISTYYKWKVNFVIFNFKEKENSLSSLTPLASLIKLFIRKKCWYIC